MIALGYPQGTPNLISLAKQRDYQNSYRKKHRLQARKARKKYYYKAITTFPSTTTRQSRFLLAISNKTKRQKIRKELAKDAYKKVLQLQKLFPNCPRRRYNLTNKNAHRSLHNSKLQRRDDMSKLQKKHSNLKSSAPSSKSASRLWMDERKTGALWWLRADLWLSQCEAPFFQREKKWSNERQGTRTVVDNLTKWIPKYIEWGSLDE